MILRISFNFVMMRRKIWLHGHLFLPSSSSPLAAIRFSKTGEKPQNGSFSLVRVYEGDGARLALGLIEVGHGLCWLKR
jgi:hypothetical protein